MTDSKTSIIVGIIIGLLIGAGAMWILNPGTGAETETYTISTAGSTTVYPLSQEWASQFHADMPSFTVTPGTGGSGLGQSQVADGLIDIGATSSYPDSTYRTANTHVEIIPVSADALGIVAHPSVNGSTFKMDCDMAVAVFQRNVTTWEDFETTFGVTIQQTGDINVYVRSDASGTTATFATWLEKADENTNPNGAEYEWGLGHKESISWIAGSNAVEGNPGVASGVKNDENGIGYVGLAFMDDLTQVVLYNPGNEEWIEPTLENALKALPDTLSDPGANLMNSDRAGAFPIARLLFYMVNKDNLNWQTLTYLYWVLSIGQQYIADVGYVPIGGTSAMAYSLEAVGSLAPSS